MFTTLSIIITTFKRPETLARAIHSAILQKSDSISSLEIIVSDDDFRQSAKPIVSSFSCPPNIFIKYLNKTSDRQNGVAESRNRALQIATGEWVMFLDDDDKLEANIASSMVKLAIDERSNFVAGHYYQAIENISQIESSKAYKKVFWDPQRLLIHNIFPIGGYIIRRQIIKHKFDAAMQTHEDWKFLIDNLLPLNESPMLVSILDLVVLTTYSCLDRQHRNPNIGSNQMITDFIKIYNHRPSFSTHGLRLSMLRSLGCIRPIGLIYPTSN